MSMQTSTAPAPAPVLKKAPTQEQILEQVRTYLPEMMRTSLQSATSIDVPLLRSAPFLDLQARAKRLGLTPMVRFEIDDRAALNFAKAVLALESAEIARSRSRLLKAAMESTRCTITLRDAKLIPPPRDGSPSGPHRIFEAHELDSMRDRNFANFDEAFEWLERAEASHATLELAKREKTIACTNPSFMACPA